VHRTWLVEEPVDHPVDDRHPVEITLAAGTDVMNQRNGLGNILTVTLDHDGSTAGASREAAAADQGLGSHPLARLTLRAVPATGRGTTRREQQRQQRHLHAAALVPSDAQPTHWITQHWKAPQRGAQLSDRPGRTPTAFAHGAAQPPARVDPCRTTAAAADTSQWCERFGLGYQRDRPLDPFLRCRATTGTPQKGQEKRND